MLVLRLRGALAAVNAAIGNLGGDLIEADFGSQFWEGLRHHSDEFFAHAAEAVRGGASLWRLSVPSTSPPLQLHGETLIEWGGSQRLVVSAQAAAQVREAARIVGGHATLFRGKDKSAGVFTPLAEPIAQIHRELKKSFDPAGVFNRGRMYTGL
jgi:glycolate oxidase FAD binding subunit